MRPELVKIRVRKGKTVRINMDMGDITMPLARRLIKKFRAVMEDDYRETLGKALKTAFGHRTVTKKRARPLTA